MNSKSSNSPNSSNSNQKQHKKNNQTTNNHNLNNSSSVTNASNSSSNLSENNNELIHDDNLIVTPDFMAPETFLTNNTDNVNVINNDLELVASTNLVNVSDEKEQELEKYQTDSKDNEMLNKLTDQLDFFKNLADENKEEIHSLKTTLEENKRLVLQLVEENEQLKNKVNKMNNVDLLLKLKENFNNKHHDLMHELNNEDASSEVNMKTNINQFVQEQVQAQQGQGQGQGLQNPNPNADLPVKIVVKPKKKGNPFARRFL